MTAVIVMKGDEERKCSKHNSEYIVQIKAMVNNLVVFSKCTVT